MSLRLTCSARSRLTALLEQMPEPARCRVTALPRDASLDAALALGGTRVATAAHPFCRCHKPKPPLPERTGTLDTYRTALDNYKAEHGSWRESHYRRRDCPVHVGTAGGA